jgi:hypothetical protein
MDKRVEPPDRRLVDEALDDPPHEEVPGTERHQPQQEDPDKRKIPTKRRIGVVLAG